ncbi:Uncharacterized protein OBRU01_21943, partial [Operophtera brumata]
SRFYSAIYDISSATRNHSVDQVEYLNSAIDNNALDWPSIKSNVLSQRGNINQKNFEGVILKLMINRRKYEAALSFANHLKSNSEEMTLGSINGLLGLYYFIGKTRKLSDEEKTFISDAYKSLYEKYKVLDFSTCEKLVRALCVIDEWEKAIWVLEDIHLTSVPSHTAFSIVVGTLFRNNKKKRAFEMISESIKHKRPLQYEAFDEWIKFILRKYKDRKAILKQLGEIHEHIARNYAVCKEKLECLKLSDEDFLKLQQNVKEKLIVGSDLFLKSSPEELQRFLSFIEKTAPYDVVIDALNVAYAVGKGFPSDRLGLLLATVDHFKEKNKKILLLGRKHMLKWGKSSIEKLKNSTCIFFTENLSEDDPYFITAAILSGPRTDIVSKDLLRGHQFNLQDEALRSMFRKWQWQHQWMLFINHKALKIQDLLRGHQFNLHDEALRSMFRKWQCQH